MKMKMKRIVALALTAGLVVGGVGAAEGAKKKKKKAKLVASDQTYFLRWDGTADECGSNYLSIKDGEDAGNGCEFAAQPAQELLIASGQGALARDWPAQDGLPFVLNSSKPITGQINIFQAFSAQGELEVVLSGTTGGRSVELGSTSVAVETAPLEVTTTEFEVAVPGKLNKKKFTGFNMNLVQRGVALSYMETEDPPSTVTIPTLVKKK